MVVNGAEPVRGAVCSTRRSQLSDQQRAPRAAQQCSWIPNQHGCAWERAVFTGGMLPVHTAGRGSVASAPATAPRATVGFPTNNAPHVLHSSAVGFPTSTAARGSEPCLLGACPWRSRLVGVQSDRPRQLIIVANGAEPVPGAVCSTRRSRISDQQRARATCCTAVQLDSQPAA